MTFFRALKGKIGIIFLVGLLCGAGAFVILSSQSKSYRSGTDFLIIQNQANTQDYYTLSRSAEYVSKILNEAVYSEVFLDEAMKEGQLGNDLLPISKKERIKEWSKIIRASRNTDLGIIHVDAFADRQRDAIRLSLAVSKVFSEKSNIFLGEGQSISVRLISGPLAEPNPSIKSLVIVVVGGFFLGILFSLMFVYYRSLPQHENGKQSVPEENEYMQNETESQNISAQIEKTNFRHRGGAPANLPLAKEDPELEKLRRKIMDEEGE